MAKKIESKAKSETDNKPVTQDHALPKAKSAAMVVKGEQGRTVIQNDVVAKIAGLAVREIEGVHKLVSFGAGQAVASLASSIRKSDMKDLGVHVEVGEKEAAIDLRVITIYGKSIPEIAEAIKANVSRRIEEMTGLRVVEVNVDVIDLYFPSDDVTGAIDDVRVE